MTRYFLIGLPLLFMSTLAYGQDPVIRIKNHLKKCVEIKLVGTETVGNVMLAKTEVKVKKPLSSCGCKSGLTRYETYMILNGEKENLAWNRVDLKNSGHMVFVANTDTSYNAFIKELIIEVECEPKH